MKCSKCGHEHEEAMGFCPMCGFVEIKGAVPETPLQQQMPLQQTAPPQQAPSSQQEPMYQAPPQQQVPVYQAPPQGNGNTAPVQEPSIDGPESQRLRNNAIASLVCGILGFVVPFVGVVLAIIAVVLGAGARKSLPENERGMATAGFVLGLIGLAFAVISIIFVLWIFGIITWVLMSISSPFFW